MRLTHVLVLTAAIGSFAPSAWAAEPGREPSVSVHGGWWDVGAEYQSPWGIFGGLGVPWIAYTPLLVDSGNEGTVSADLRLGYDYPLTKSISLRALFLSAWIYQWGDPCGDGCTVHEHKFFNFLSAGLLYRFPCGFLLGFEMPLVAEESNHSQEPGDTGWHRPEWFPPPISVLFSQVYIGYGWDL